MPGPIPDLDSFSLFNFSTQGILGPITTMPDVEPPSPLAGIVAPEWTPQLASSSTDTSLHPDPVTFSILSSEHYSSPFHEDHREGPKADPTDGFNLSQYLWPEFDESAHMVDQSVPGLPSDFAGWLF